MDATWPSAALVLALGAVWALFDAWWTRRRWRLDRERRRVALRPPGAADTGSPASTVEAAGVAIPAATRAAAAATPAARREPAETSDVSA